jgi:hypothetical protein
LILLLNGAFGIGKTTAARSLARRLPRSLVLDPEPIGVALQRMARLAGRRVDDFQDLSSWRLLTVAGIRAARVLWPDIIVPMAFSNTAYLEEMRSKLAHFDPVVIHACLTAPLEIVHQRLRSRGADPDRHRWQFRRAAECCAVHGNHDFAEQVPTENRSEDDVVDQLLNITGRRLTPPASAGKAADTPA